MMVVKLKKGMKILGTCLWLLAGVFLCGKIEVYGVEGRLTEEEVKRQVVEIVEEDREGEVVYSTIVEYDIEKIYRLNCIYSIINKYIDGIPLKKIIEEADEQGEKKEYWILPYHNIKKEKCYATFEVQDERIELSSKTWGIKNNLNMKLYEGKYNEIVMGEVNEVFYIRLELFDFEITYVILCDGKELVIPFFRNETNHLFDLKSGKVYDVNTFMVELYNSCNEPTEAELKELGKINSMGDMSLLVKRKQKLNYKSIKEIRFAEKVKNNSWIFGVITTLVLFGTSIYIKKKRKKL